MPWCWCNFACYSSVLKNNKVNESYPMGEDTELFARLKKLGYKGVELPIAPVLHERKYKGFAKSIKNSFIYGKLLTQINLKYGDVGFKSGKKAGGNIIVRELATIFSRIFFMFGIFYGYIAYKIKKIIIR